MQHNNTKQALLGLQQELEQRIARIEQEQKERNTPDNDLWSDQASLHERDSEQITLHLSAKAELNQIQHALNRLENGTYGVCSVCGAEIEASRLEAVPFATRCKAHAE